jgi:hypothetical protein
MYLVGKNCGKTRVHKTLHWLMADRGFKETQAIDTIDEIGLHCLDRRVVNAVGLMQQKMYEVG